MSLNKNGIKMHAAPHEGYTSMYEYVRKPSTKKPLSELDAEFFMSLDHPRGDALRRLLEAGARANNAYEGRRTRRRALSVVTDAVPGHESPDNVTPKRFWEADV